MNYTQEQFDKLPVWAKSVIRMLETDVKTLRDNSHNLYPGSNVVVVDMLEEIPLKPNARIRFYMATRGPYGRKSYIDISIDRETGTELDIRSANKLSIAPCAANAIKVTDA